MEALHPWALVSKLLSLGMRSAQLKKFLVELSESVEFKSLPSGLHNVQEDLMYDGRSVLHLLMLI